MNFLETDRLLIEKPQPRDPFLCSLFEDKEIMSLIHPGGYSSVESPAILDLIHSWWDEAGFGPGVLKLKKCGTPVGNNGVKLISLDGERDKVLDLGFMLLPEYRGQGYIHESSVALIDFAKKNKFKRVVAHTFAVNIPTHKALKKLDFEKLRPIESFTGRDGYELWGRWL